MRLVAVYQSGNLKLGKEADIYIPDGFSLTYVKSYNEAGNFVALYNDNHLRIVSEAELLQITGKEDFYASLDLLRNLSIKFTTIFI